ncbi:hypothetical protein DAPPUDRAFT_261031 [Daphnia pulex]|uniref:Uncharacterized protein n=1 Tax=Daphnia pulex TaxID=6669 RepID=E9HKE6_DAPPU|nr:hypothetical protein DAPPUDRAFT_261031 [Daphnia pulex]|eukprot:EFX67796.1 hypothetical protein DAPPUDRAFT_261031 [Daphnia pulex]
MEDLFTAGSNTSSGTIGFRVLYMIDYPTIPQKIREDRKCLWRFSSVTGTSH